MKQIKYAILAVAGIFLFACGGGGGGGSVGKGAITTIVGKVTYDDRTYDSNGFTGTATLPVRFAKVEVMQNDVATASGVTDSAGAYSISGGIVAGSAYVRVLSEAGSPYAIVVQDNRDKSTYAVKSGTFTVADKDIRTVDLAAGMADVGQVFNIFDNLVKTQKVLNDLSGSAPPLITAYWYSGKTEGTWYYSSGGKNFIDLLGTSTDSDSYDDSVILHEMGHYAAQVYSKDSSPGGSHSVTGHYDIRLTWSEGWASFFQSMTKGINAELNPQWYVDTTGGSGTGSSTIRTAFEINTPSYASVAIGADNEIAVSSLLWHIYASPSDTTHLALGAAAIWSVVSTDLSKVTGDVSFESFYDKWIAGTGRSASQLAPLLADRSVKYLADAYEADDTAATAQTVTLPFTAQSHTFFPAGDKDWFKISVTSGTAYTFTTSALGDGADTLLTLYDTDKTTQLAQNDDIGEVCPIDSSLVSTVASKIKWTANATKTVFLKVEPYRPLISGTDISFCSTVKGGSAYTYPAAVGKYGYYTISIQ